MSNLIERRDRIRQAVPHLASASGSIASFQTDMRAGLEEIKIHFNPLQSGSGTPSPTNVRPLSGWTGCNLYISPTQDASQGNQIPVSWSSLGTVYGGWVNPVSGEVWQAWTKQHLDGTCVSGFDGPYTNPSRYRVYTTAMSPIPYTSTDETYDCIVSDKFGTAVDTTSPSPNILTYNRNRRMLIGVPDTYTTKQDAIDWINGMGGFDVSYLLATPVLVGTISPIALKTLVGQNNIWSSANGDVDVKYWKH